MTKQLKTIEILNPSKSATCSMWRYPESAKIFQYRGMDFDGFRVIRVKEIHSIVIQFAFGNPTGGTGFTLYNCVLCHRCII